MSLFLSVVLTTCASQQQVDISSMVQKEVFEEYTLPLERIKEDATAAQTQHAKVLEELAGHPLTSQETAKKYPHKNRPHGILPRDNLLITSNGSKYGTAPVDYLNANLLKVPESNYTYIAAQSPLTGLLPQYPEDHIVDTVPDFYNALIENDTHVISAIVMHMEPKFRKGEISYEEKGSQYWIGPIELGNGFVFEGSSEIALSETDTDELSKIQQKENTQEGVIVRKLFITKDGASFREIIQFHYQNWPDKGVPNPVVFAFYEKLMDRQIKKDRDQGNIAPPLVHCSAGHGRTAIFLACRLIRDYVEAQIDQGLNLDEINLNLPKLLFHMNLCRPLISLSENHNQYNAILKWIETYSSELRSSQY